MRVIAKLHLLAVGACAVSVLLGCAAKKELSPHAVGETVLANVPETSDARFEHDVIDSDTPVLVGFYASWCPPCRRMDPILSDLATMYKDKAKIVRINVDKNPKISTRYRITAVPHIMVFKNGDLVDDVLGQTSRERLSYTLDRTL